MNNEWLMENAGRDGEWIEILLLSPSPQFIHPLSSHPPSIHSDAFFSAEIRARHRVVKRGTFI